MGLEKDINKLKNIKVPKEGFDLLLKIADLFGYDYDTTKLIINNLPNNYDLSKLDKDLIKKIIKYHNNLIIFLIKSLSNFDKS